MFEKAIRLKYRFNTPQGILTTEQLYDLPLSGSSTRANLDDIAKGLYKQLKSGDDVSFVVEENRSDSLTQDKFDLVRHVIKVKQAENAAQADAKHIAEQKQVVLGFMKEFENEELRKSIKKMTPEQRKEMIDSLSKNVQ